MYCNRVTSGVDDQQLLLSFLLGAEALTVANVHFNEKYRRDARRSYLIRAARKHILFIQTRKLPNLLKYQNQKSEKG
jgi:hypothetical protein